MKRALPLLAFLIAGGAVLAVLSPRIDRGPFERTPMGMEAVYWSAAAQGTAVTAPGIGNPVYPQILRALVSPDPGTVAPARRVLTTVSLSLFAVLVLVLVWRRAGPWYGALSGVGTLVAGPLVLSAGTLTPAVPGALLLLLALVLLDAGGSRIVFWGLTGVLIGLAGRLEPQLSWVLLVLLVLGALFRPLGEKRLVRPAVLAGGWLAAVVLTALVFESPPLFPRVSGIEMYRGHRAAASGVDPRRGDADSLRWWGMVDFVREASREENRLLSLPEAESVWASRAPGGEFTRPLATLKRAGVKTLASFQGDPLPREVSSAFIQERSDGKGLGIALWVGRILIPLGLVGLVVAGRRTGRALGTAALSGLGAALLTYATPDIRILTVAAALGGVGLWAERMIRGSLRTRMVALGGGVAAVGVLGFWPPAGGTPGLGISGDDHYHLGTVYEMEQRGSAAIREYERALRLDPTNPYPHLAIARMLAADNVNQEAILELEQLRTRYPGFVPGLVGLTRLYEAEEEWRNATTVYDDLIAQEPWNPEHWNNLGTMYVQLGLYGQAVRALEQALQLAPDYQTARGNLQSLQARGLAPGLPGEGADSLRVAQEKILTSIRNGQTEEAERLLGDAYTRFGEDRVEFRFVEGTLRLVSRDFEEAVAIFESLRGSMGSNVILLNNLGAAYRGLGNLEKAIEVYEEALRIHPSNERVRVALEELRRPSGDAPE